MCWRAWTNGCSSFSPSTAPEASAQWQNVHCCDHLSSQVRWDHGSLLIYTYTQTYIYMYQHTCSHHEGSSPFCMCCLHACPSSMGIHHRQLAGWLGCDLSCLGFLKDRQRNCDNRNCQSQANSSSHKKANRCIDSLGMLPSTPVEGGWVLGDLRVRGHYTNSFTSTEKKRQKCYIISCNAI